MTAPANPRQNIDDAIAAGQTARAVAALREYWWDEPSLPRAPFVVDRFTKLGVTAPRTPTRVMVLRSFTVEPLAPLLRAAAACWGLDVEARLGDFNAYVQEILDPASALYTEPTDVAILAVQTRDIAPELWNMAAGLTAAETQSVVERVVANYRTWIDTLRSRSNCHLIVHNLEKPPQPAAGIYDAQLPGGQSRAIEQINADLAALCSDQAGVHVLDYDNLVGRAGRERWFDPQKWVTARLPIAGDCLMYLVDEWVRYLVPAMGRQAKCLVVDLDNTLWGGVIGEDGMHGIKLGGDYPGAAYLELQRAVSDLMRRGVILAISSKNNEADALEALDEHPEMLLRSKDFAARRINWSDKAQNLREIAGELNIGLDTLVFVDDNPVECEFIREVLPEVTVLNVDPQRPFSHARVVRNCPRFERLEISAEDRRRNELYAAQIERAQLQTSAATLEDYYRSLDMVATFGLVDEATRARVAQLTQKTNQLNMTTRRYAEQQIGQFTADREMRVFWTQVADRFGDNGIVGVMIVRVSGDTWQLDTFLMSCRVIGRTVETAMLGMLAQHARSAGATRLVGEFVPTAKNAPAKDIYPAHGFRATGETDSGTIWELDLGSANLAVPDWIECRMQGAPPTYGE
jgi:FkbH-like protein